MVIKNKPIEKYNKAELNNLIKAIKGELKGQVNSDNCQSKIEQLRANANHLVQVDHMTPQIMNNIAIAENHMETIMVNEHTFSTAIIVDSIWNTIHGSVQQSKLNYIDKYARH